MQYQTSDGYIFDVINGIATDGDMSSTLEDFLQQNPDAQPIQKIASGALENGINIQITCADSGEDYGVNLWIQRPDGVWVETEAYYRFADYGDFEDYEIVTDYISDALSKNETSGEIQTQTNFTYSFRKA